MIKAKRRKFSIKSRILTSVLLLITTIIIGIAVSFNLLVNRYIEKTSNAKLKEAKFIIMQDGAFNVNAEPKNQGRQYRKHTEEEFMKNFDKKIKKAKLKSDAQVIIVDDNNKMIFPVENENLEEETEIYNDVLHGIKKSDVKLNLDQNIRISTEKGNYYLSKVKIKNNESTENRYAIPFINISSTLFFAKQINTVLLVIMCIAGVLAVGITLVLSNKIAKPIKQISTFANKLGEGDFSPCDIKFCDKEIHELSEVMNKTADALDKYDKEQKTFFQNASHELRTPLMSIKGYAEAIKYNVLDKGSASEIILEESNRLVGLIEELLYVSKVDNITKDCLLTECDLREILSNCTLKEKPIAIKLGINFKYDFDDEPVLLKCDEKSIYRAFLNIIDNALRYAKSEIIIQCKNIGDSVFISIKNNGENIEEKDLPYIFDRFYKGNKGKHGIGLSIVKSIVNKHEGNIRVQNTNYGVEFKINF